MKIIEIMTLSPVIPVMVIDDVADAIPLAKALVEGGLKVLEITLRTGVAIESIKAIKAAVPKAIVGSGTVVNFDTFKASLAAGVDFMVSPGMSTELLKASVSESIEMLPGSATASEAMNLLDAGFHCQKFFPAEAAGGAAYLKSLAGPLPQITFCPTGGISMANARNYLMLSNVACVGGSWMLDKQLIRDKNWQEITRLSREICNQLK
ncbi:MAG: keto-deoxy-phosphogluconate aldolase [Gammaproteobacteria bacterium]|nr:MAG: keto-deoxy-phosphogluconate aldolase [Gammaproteobacteria bacterium]